MTRNTKGAGTLRHRGNGAYLLRVYAGRDPVTGKPRYVGKTVHVRNVTEARKALAAFVREHEGKATAGGQTTVRVLMAEWIAQLEADGKAPRTIAEARRTADRHINPALGDVKLADLTARHIDELNRRTVKLAPSSRRRYHAVFAAALNQAVRWDWIKSSPTVQASAPKLAHNPLVVPTTAEIDDLIRAMPAGVWQTAIRIAAFTGARRGELCALRWSDIDGDTLRIRRSVYRLTGETVEKRTKSDRERSIVIVPMFATMLDDWRERCEAGAESIGVVVPSDGFILSSWPDCSRPLNPDTLSAHVRRAAVDLGIPHVHLHSIRHYAATKMLAGGIGPRDVAEVLGHADGGKLALQVYGHPTTEGERAAAAAMARALPAGAW